MIQQYSETNSSISADIQNIVANDISLMDEYILIQTGQYEWTALIKTVGMKNTREIVITRLTGTGYNNTYTVTRKPHDGDFKAVLSNEYYSYSNMGYGKSLDLPVHDGVQSWSIMIICCVLMFAVLFKGALFKCLKVKKR